MIIVGLCDKLVSVNYICRTGNREQGTGNREQGTGNRGQEIGNREQGSGLWDKLVSVNYICRTGNTASDEKDLRQDKKYETGNYKWEAEDRIRISLDVL